MSEKSTENVRVPTKFPGVYQLESTKKMIEWDLYAGPNPMAKVKMPKVDNARDRFLTPDEAQTLLAAVKKRSPFWHDISLISLHTGMRLSEILGLRPQDVDLNNRLIHLDGKTGKRSIPMNDILFEALFRVVEERKDTSLLFPGRNGHSFPLTPPQKALREL